MMNGIKIVMGVIMTKFEYFDSYFDIYNKNYHYKLIIYDYWFNNYIDLR